MTGPFERVPTPKTLSVPGEVNGMRLHHVSTKPTREISDLHLYYVFLGYLGAV